MDLRFLVLVCLFAVGTNSRGIPVSSVVENGKCVPESCQENDVLQYKTGKSYVYKYTTRTRISQWNSEVKVNGLAIITKLSPCEYSLKLAEINIDGPKDASQLVQQLEASVSRFTNKDGLINEICHEQAEEPWVVNIKKAILSGLQISVQSLERGVRTTRERDLMGDCETTYENMGESYKGITLKKTKNLMSCRNRFTDSLASIWQVLMSSGQYEHECILQINSKDIIVESRCKQASRDKVNDKSTLELIFKEEKPASSELSSDISGYKRTSLLFTPQPCQEKSLNSLRLMLEALSLDTENEIKKTAPQEFRDFVRAIGHSKYESLKQLWSLVEQNSLSGDSFRVKKIFLDAVVQSSSGPALKLAVEDIHPRGKISGTQIKAMIHALALKTEHVSSETIHAIIALLKSDITMHQSYFGLTAGIQKYLNQGHNSAIATEALRLIVDKIDVNDYKVATIIVRALGNVQLPDEKVEQKLLSLIDQSNAELAVAAIDTLGKVYPRGKAHQVFEKVIKSRSYPIEVRITAFKYFLRGLEGDDLDKIVRSIPESDSNMRDYVYSYLNSKESTMNPDYQGLRIEIDRAQNVELKADKNFVRSRHFSTSRLTRDGLIGFNMESDVIVEDNHKVPTWFIFNASVPVRRQNLHSFEIGVRQEGLDEIASEMMEKVRQHNWQYALNEIKERKNFSPLLKELNNMKNEMKSKVAGNGKLSVYVEMNEQTIFYLNGARDSKRSAVRPASNPIRQLLESSQGLNHVFAMALANYQASYPLMSGLEVKYWHASTFVAGLKSESTSGTRFFYPNFAADYVMGYDLRMLGKIGGEVRNYTLSSNFHVRYDISYERGQYFNLTLHVTEPEMDWFRIESHSYLRKNNGELVENKSTMYNKKNWCFGTHESFGVQMCVSQGPSDLGYGYIYRVYTKKSDSGMNKIVFSWMKNTENEHIFSFDTPNSVVSRAVELRLKKDLRSGRDKELRASLRTPKLQLAAEGMITKTDDKIAVPINVIVNKKTHTVRLELSKSRNDAKLRITSPKFAEPLDYDIQVSKSSKAIEEHFVKIHHNSKSGKRTQVLMVRASPESWKSVNDFKGVFQVEANCPHAGNLLTMSHTISRSQEYPAKVDSKISYLKKGKQQQASLNAAVRDLSTDSLMNYRISGAAESSELENKGFKLQQDISFSSTFLDNKLDVAWGKNYKQANTLSMKQKAKLNLNQLKKEIISSFEWEYEPKNQHHKIDASYHQNRASDLATDKLILKHMNLKKNSAASEREFLLLRERKDNWVSYSLDTKCPRGDRKFRAQAEKIDSDTYKAFAKYEHSKASSNPVFEAKMTTNLKPVDVSVEILRSNSRIIRARSTYDMKRADDISLTTELHYKEKQILKASASRKQKKIEASVESIHGHSADVKAEIDRQVVFDYKREQQPVYQFVLIKNIGATGVIYDIKSLTKRGSKIVPDILFYIEPSKFDYDLQVKGDYYDFSSKGQKLRQSPKASFSIAFDCKKHRNVHKTEFVHDDKKCMLTSKTAVAGTVIYEFRAIHEKTPEGKHNSLKFKAPNTLDLVATQLISPNEEKFNITMSGKRDLEFSVVTLKNAMIARGRRSIAAEPKSTKVRFIYKSKESDKTYKAFGEYKNSPKALRLTSIEFTQGGQRKFLGSANIARDSPLSVRVLAKGQSVDLEVNPWNDQKTMKFEYKTTAAQGSLSGNLKAQNNQIKIQGRVNHENKKQKNQKLSANFDTNLKIAENAYEGDVKMEWQHPRSSGQQKMITSVKIDKKISLGPHEVKFTTNDAEARFTHQVSSARTKSLSKTLLSITRDSQLVLEVQLKGDIEKNPHNVAQLTADINSVKYESLKGIKYHLKAENKPGKLSLEAKRSKDGKIRLVSLEREIVGDTVKNMLNINGYFRDGSQGKFSLKSECNRPETCKFDAKLMKNDQKHSELNVVIPLVRITEFITRKASARFESTAFDSQASLKINAPAANQILVEADAKYGSSKLAYKLEVSNGQKFKPYGSESVAHQSDAVLFDHELRYNDLDRPVMGNKIMVSQNVIATNLILGSFESLNTLVSGDKPRAIGKTCLKGEKHCAEYNVRLVNISPYGAKYEMDLTLKKDSQDMHHVKSVIDYNLRKNNERLSVLSTIKERKYGFDVERTISSTKRIVKAKAILPERTPEVLLEYQPSDNEMIGKIVFSHDNKKPSERMMIDFNRKFSRSGSKHIYDTLITLNHQSIREPLQIKSRCVSHKSSGESSFFGLLGQEYSLTVSHGDQKLTWEREWLLKDNKFNFRFRLYNGDGKIDLGCVGGQEWMKTYSNKRNYQCFWVDRNGKKQTMERKMEMERDSDKVSFIQQIRNPLMAYKLAGKIHLANWMNLAEFDLTIPEGPSFKTKMSVETVQDTKCFVITTKSSESSQVYKVRSCINLRPRGDEQLISFNIKKEGSNEHLVSFYIVRMAEFARDFKVTLEWNPQSVSDALLGLIRAYENKAKQEKLFAEESRREVIHKMEIVRNTFGQNLLKPMKSFWDKEFDNLTREMSPELEAINKIMPRKNSRIIRSLAPYDRASHWEDITSPLSFEWVVKDLDGGQIVFIVRNVEAKNIPSALIKGTSSLLASYRASRY
ncbi:uncharacterized protein LOC141849348 [Brevipalpus obovatus]|uniref:uncharacterized protein LOC141849348 n=1 Tax=Brevipalpus obovatus TaxID=246614 RepID=UPI003D9F8AF9